MGDQISVFAVIGKDAYRRGMAGDLSFAYGAVLKTDDREEQQIIPQRDGSFVMTGEADMDEVCKALDIHDEELEDFDTLNGFLVSRIDKIPTEGESYAISAYGYSFQVVQVLDKMIGRVRVRRLPEKSGEESEILSGDR